MAFPYKTIIYADIICLSLCGCMTANRENLLNCELTVTNKGDEQTIRQVCSNSDSKLLIINDSQEQLKN